MCFLIKYGGYGSEVELKSMYLHDIISRFEWFKKDYKEEQERLSKMRCPLLSYK
jgi:hypothetical protein